MTADPQVWGFKSSGAFIFVDLCKILSSKKLIHFFFSFSSFELFFFNILSLHYSLVCVAKITFFKKCGGNFNISKKSEIDVKENAPKMCYEYTEPLAQTHMGKTVYPPLLGYIRVIT